MARQSGGLLIVLSTVVVACSSALPLPPPGSAPPQFGALATDALLHPVVDEPTLQHAQRAHDEHEAAVVLASTDPANPYGAALPWPEGEGARPMRAAGTHVALVDGALAAYVGRGEREIRTFLPAEEPQRSSMLRGLATALAAWASRANRPTLGWATANAQPLALSPLAPFLIQAGFARSGPGFRFAGTTSLEPAVQDRPLETAPPPPADEDD